MKCPRCESNRVYHSRAKTFGDRVVKRVIPVKIYRCHDCNWRKARLKGGSKAVTMHFVSLAGYIGGFCLLLGVVALVIILTLSFLGVRVPWLG